MSVAHVRPAAVPDAEGLAELAALTFPLACPPHTTQAAKDAFIQDVLSAARFREYLTDPARVVLVAHVTDGPGTAPVPLTDTADLAGYAMLVDAEPADPDVRAVVRVRPTIELSKFYVHPDHHGQGVANALMRAVLDIARRRDRAGIWLGVNNENVRAQRFYARHGFAVVGTKHFQVGGRLEDDFVLERPLADLG